MWLLAEYEATALFSLKPATATSSGGRTLLVPSPYAIKMAVLDVACKVNGVTAAVAACRWLAGARVALRPSARVVVNNTIIRVLRPFETKQSADKKEEAVALAKRERKYPFGKTISYREYAQLAGSFGIAIEVETDEAVGHLQNWLIGINYLGKRGSFVQIQAVPEIHEVLPDKFIRIGEAFAEFPIEGLLTQLDDTGAESTFETLSIYSGERVRIGKERLLHHVALPYRLLHSSRSYSYYEALR